MAPSADRRTFFVGDSSVAADVGDPGRRGWIGRLAEHADRAGVPITVYDLGVRHDSSDDIARRWAGEVAARRAAGSEDRVVVSFGVNDTTLDGGLPRVPPERSVANLHAVLDEAAGMRLPAFVVGPTPVADAEHNRRLAELDARLGGCAAQRGVPYVTVFAALVAAPRWTDGAGRHPTAEGHALLAELVAPDWTRWLRGDGPGEVGP